MIDVEKLLSVTNTCLCIQKTMTKEEILEKFQKVANELEIIGEDEDDEFIYLHFAKGNTIVVKKPRNQLQIEIILLTGRFPQKIIREIWHPKPTKCLKIAEKAIKPLILCGPAGIGKTYACIWKISELAKYNQINTPLYVPFQEILTDEIKSYKNHDCFLLDDVNGNLSPWKVELIRSIIYHAYNHNKRLFITSNLEQKEFLKLLNEEPIVSRLLEICEIHEVVDKDFRQLRLQSA